MVPLHRIELKSNVVTGSVAFGIRKSLPIPDVTFILGNGIGGGNVWKNNAVLPQVAFPDKPLVHHCGQQHPDVFPACTVMRAMALHSSSSEEKEHSSSLVDLDFSDSFCDLSDSFLVSLDDFKTPKSPGASCAGSERSCKVSSETVCLSPEMLIDAQKVYVSLASLFQLASSDVDLDKEPQCLFFQDGILMRKWRPYNVPDQCNSLEQIVKHVNVSSPYHPEKPGCTGALSPNAEEHIACILLGVW